MKVRAHIYIAGRVQGVFFRSEIRREARKHNITGWVRNLPDGRVETVVEGEEEDVKKVIEFCKVGPSGARVTKTQVTLQNYYGEFSYFQVIW
jgi:acylphosphatase